MNLDISIVGYFAGVLTSVAQFPQAYKVYKTKDTESISLGMYSLMTIGVVFWLLYGILKKDLPMILANGTCLVPSSYTLYKTVQNTISKKHKA